MNNLTDITMMMTVAVSVNYTTVNKERISMKTIQLLIY